MIPLKEKSAPTEVNAPKNANPDCRQTNINRMGYDILSTLPIGICVFSKFIKVVCTKKNIIFPKNIIPLNLFIKFVWQI